jgi:hypothetical protein
MTTAETQTLAQAIQTLGRRLGEPLDRIAQQRGDAGSDPGTDSKSLAVYLESRSDSEGREEVIIRYTKGKVKFVEGNDDWGEKRRYGLLRMNMYKLDGKEDGTHDTIWMPDATLEEMYQRPPLFEGPFDRPSPIREVRLRAHSKAVWEFKEGDRIYATGPANLLLVPFKDGSQIFLVSVAAIITGGTGRYEGCSGVKTALGSSLVPAGVNVLEMPLGHEFDGTTVETFRVVRRQNIGRPPV